MQNEHMNALIDTEDWVRKTQELLLMTPCRPQITTPLFLLMLTGQASPFLHNGIMEPEDADFEGGWNWGDGKVTVCNRPGSSSLSRQIGVIARNEIGYLYWNKDEFSTMSSNLVKI